MRRQRGAGREAHEERQKRKRKRARARKIHIKAHRPHTEAARQRTRERGTDRTDRQAWVSGRQLNRRRTGSRKHAKGPRCRRGRTAHLFLCGWCPCIRIDPPLLVRVWAGLCRVYLVLGATRERATKTRRY